MEVLEPGASGNKIYPVTMLDFSMNQPHAMPATDVPPVPGTFPAEWETEMRNIQRKLAFLAQHQTEMFQCLQMTIMDYTRHVTAPAQVNSPAGRGDDPVLAAGLIPEPVARQIMEKLALLEMQGKEFQKEILQREEGAEELRLLQRKNQQYQERILWLEQEIQRFSSTARTATADISAELEQLRQERDQAVAAAAQQQQDQKPLLQRSEALLNQRLALEQHCGDLQRQIATLQESVQSAPAGQLGADHLRELKTLAREAIESRVRKSNEFINGAHEGVELMYRMVRDEMETPLAAHDPEDTANRGSGARHTAD